MTKDEANEISRAIGQLPFNFHEQLCSILNQVDLPFLWVSGYVYGQNEDDERKSLARMLFVVDRSTVTGIVLSTLSPETTP